MKESFLRQVSYDCRQSSLFTHSDIESYLRKSDQIKNIMTKTDQKIPVTELSAEQAPAYEAVCENEINSNSKTENNMEETTKTENQYSSSTNGKLSKEQLEYCEKAVQDLVEKLESDGLAGTVMRKSIINITGAHKTGKINVARLKMNRKPKQKAVRALQEAMMLSGQQIMLLVIPAKVAKNLGFEIESFDETEIREDELSMTVVIIDGQTRMKAYLEAIKEDPNSQISNLYAYFPLNWVNMNDMLTSINLKVFTWKNSDFMTGVLSQEKMKSEDRGMLEYIKELESKGYNYTSACEWATLKKGIITKTPLVKAMSSINPSLDTLYSQNAIKISKAAREKFEGDNESALKRKAFPEFIIIKWNEAGRELNYSEREDCLIKFFNELSDDEVKNIVFPCEYKRGCGRKREEFVIENLEASFNTFLSKHPYSTFKKV